MKKRIISLFLAIIMVAGMLPTAAFAAEDNTPGHITGLTVSLNGELCEGAVTVR